MDLVMCLEWSPSNDGHQALQRRLGAISRDAGVPLDIAWKQPGIAAGEIPRADGVIVPNGPTSSFEGQVLCCKTARESGTPILGICGGLQAQAVDVARHLAGLPEANSTEYLPTTPAPVVHEDGRPCGRAAQAVRLIPGGDLADLYGSVALEGVVRCGRFVNRAYWHLLERAGLKLLATSADGERILGFRLANHPFYLGVAFLPQLNATVGRPEPLLARFLQTITHHHQASQSSNAR